MKDTSEVFGLNRLIPGIRVTNYRPNYRASDKPNSHEKKAESVVPATLLRLLTVGQKPRCIPWAQWVT